MASSRKTTKKTASVAQMPAPGGGTATLEDIPDEFQEPQADITPAAPADARPDPARMEPAIRNGRNPLKKKASILPQSGNFWQRVAAVPRQDWDQNRVYLYLYVLEPLCNLKQQGGKAYFNRYSCPIKDEHQIAVECGSGRYRLMLSYNRVSADDNSEIAQFEFEIYNPQYPPKVPRAAWINDPRNAKWEALLPEKAAPAAAGSGGTLVEAMRVYKDIRSEVRDEIGDTEQPAPRGADEMLQTMKIAKEIFGAPAVAAVPATDPMDLALKLFQVMNTMKSENPVIDMYKAELSAIREELRDARKQQTPAKDPFTMVFEFITSDKFESVKKVISPLLGIAGGSSGAEVVGRAARTSFYDIARDFINSPMGSGIGQGLGNLLINLATPAPAANGMPAAQRAPVVLNERQNNGTQAPAEDVETRVNRIGQTITQPMLYQYFLRDEPGEVFAQSMFDLWPEDYMFMRQLGAENIIARYRRFAPAWALIAPKEPAFIEFINEFCSWDPNEEEGEPEPAGATTEGIIDLENEGGN
jgi:hypothetical protein